MHAVDLDDEHTAGIVRIADAVCFLYRSRDDLIHDFKRGGNDAVPNNGRYRLARVRHTLEDCEIGLNRLRDGQELNEDLRNHAHGAFGADDRTHQVVARRVRGLAA